MEQTWPGSGHRPGQRDSKNASSVRVRRQGLEPRTRGLRVRSSGVLLLPSTSMFKLARWQDIRNPLRRVPSADGLYRVVPGHPSKHGANMETVRSRPLWKAHHYDWVSGLPLCGGRRAGVRSTMDTVRNSPTSTEVARGCGIAVRADLRPTCRAPDEPVWPRPVAGLALRLLSLQPDTLAGLVSEDERAAKRPRGFISRSGDTAAGEAGAALEP